MKRISNTQSTDLPEDVVMSVRSVSKKFCRNLKRSMVYGMQDLARNLVGLPPQSTGHRLKTINPDPAFQRSSVDDGLRRDEFWALRDISFDLKRGECLGLIGSNGSGKSTLLRVLNGIFPPDAGIVSFRGRIGALIALGAGFHPHLTGRENVFLNGAILGIDRDRMNSIFDQIVQFSEIGGFIDAPVSTYSSGMYVRLGFAIAASVEPEIMLIDEVLAVGDIAFRAKCAQRLHDMRARGMAVIFVAHDMFAVQSLCDRVVWLDQGSVRSKGGASGIIEEYLQDTARKTMRKGCGELVRDGQDGSDIDITKVTLRNAAGVETDTICPFEPLTVEIHYNAVRRVDQPFFWIGIATGNGSVGGANMLLDGKHPAILEGAGIIKCHFDSLPLMPQVYYLRGGIRAADRVTMLIESRQIGMFRIAASAADMGLDSLAHSGTPVCLNYEWEFPDGRRESVKHGLR